MIPLDFYELAERLAREAAEASQRSAVSRAYYAVLHEARVLVESCGFKFSNSGEIHSKLPYCLYHTGDLDLDFTARSLEALRRGRNVADYDFASTAFSKKDSAAAHLVTAKEAFDAIRAARSKLSVLRPLVRQYASNVLKKVLQGDE